ncbi:hypothetical protein DXG01_008942 [Tephrocybe rancida]|nr:hypothetical protein DXG01_008942 [Tephrocybe rancida]
MGSITMDTWTKEQVEPMKSIGNVKSNAIYNPNEVRNPPPPNLMDGERDSELEQYIRSKYQFKRFLNKSALVSSKLSPSRPSIPAPSTGRLPSSGSFQTSSTPLASAVSNPSVSTIPPQVPSQRRSTLATAPPPRTVPQPLPTSQDPRQRQTPSQTNGTSNPSSNGVWDDLVSLQAPSSSSSLPLQFQALSQAPLTPQGYQTSMATGVNPFQQQHLASNPYSQSIYPSGLQSSSFAPGPQFSSLNSSQPTYFSAQQQPPMSAPASQTQNNNFYQPQPQQALQVQPSAGQALFNANNGQNGSSFMSAPATQGHFQSTSPAQFPSQSPQLISTTPQPHMYTTTPQPQMFSTTPQPQMQHQPQMMGQFMPTPSQQFQMQQQGGLGLGSMQSQGQMQMGQQAFFQPQAPGFQPQGQFGGNFQQQPYSAGGFTGGQQWGTM